MVIGFRFWVIGGRGIGNGGFGMGIDDENLI